jgi:hypothetical protein
MKLSRCLHDLGIAEATIFEDCDDVNDEFKVIRKIYLKKVLQEHPVSVCFFIASILDCHCHCFEINDIPLLLK